MKHWRKTEEVQYPDNYRGVPNDGNYAFSYITYRHIPSGTTIEFSHPWGATDFHYCNFCGDFHRPRGYDVVMPDGEIYTSCVMLAYNFKDNYPGIVVEEVDDETIRIKDE